MLGPDGPHLFFGCELTAVSGRLGASNRLALVGRKDNRYRKIGACKLHDGSRYVILIVRRQTTHGLHSFIEELCHGHNIRWGNVEVEELAAALPLPLPLPHARRLQRVGRNSGAYCAALLRQCPVSMIENGGLRSAN
jgi:hypothetical protein